MNFVLLVGALMVSGSVAAETDPERSAVEALVRQAFAAARICHTHSVLYGQIRDARRDGAERAFIDKKLNTANAPLIAALVNSAYDKPLTKTLDPEQFYAECASKMHGVVIKGTPVPQPK